MNDKSTSMFRQYKISKYSDWCLGVIFAMTIYLQCCIFHYLTFHSILISSIWNNPLAFWTFHLPKISISIFISSFIFLFKRKSWAIVASILINVWIMTELIYCRANSVFLDAYSMTMASNMAGFWDSVLVFVSFGDLLLLIPTTILMIGLYIFNNQQSNWKKCLTSLSISIVLSCLGLHMLYNYNLKWRTFEDGTVEERYKYTLNPFGKKIRNVIGDTWVLDGTITKYISNLSVLHHFVLNLVDIIKMDDSDFNMPYEDEKFLLENFVHIHSDDSVAPSNSLIICLIESFETWSISEEITPNLYKEITNNQNLLYCPNLISQRRAGNSADGQMIINTGLLPLQEGAAVFRFPFNKYPSLSSLYENSAGIFPHELGAWNQRYMNQSYKIDTGIVVSTSDKVIFPKIIKETQSNDYILALTMSTHAPYNTYADSSNLCISDEFPQILTRYLKCVNVMDEGLGILLRAWHTNEKIHNSTIVITSDHNIFKGDEVNEFKVGNSRFIDSINGMCPLIIISPNINKNIYLQDTCYQMDIYPTILHLINCENYYWKGFGVNILDSVARNNRVITEKDAFILSDKIIRSNWFNTINN